MKKQSGFTLIELMIVVAIVGILAAVAIPAYQDYVARSQVSEAVASTSAMKVSIVDFYSTQGVFPADGQFDQDAGGRYTLPVTHAGSPSVITATMRGASPVNTRVRGFAMDLTPNLNANGIILGWTCTAAGGGDIKFLPSGCQ